MHSQSSCMTSKIATQPEQESNTKHAGHEHKQPLHHATTSPAMSCT
jgi:hypothetical protein